MDVRLFLIHSLTDAPKFRPYILPGISFLQEKGALFGQRWSVFPHPPHKVMRAAKTALLFLGDPVINNPFRNASTLTVKPDYAIFRKFFFQETFDRINPRFPHLIERNFASSQFFFRLYEISSVRPQTRFVLCKHRGSGRAGKTGHKLPCFEIFSHILAVMVVGGRDNIDINALPLHLCAKSIYSVRNIFNCIIISIIINFHQAPPAA